MVATVSPAPILHFEIERAMIQAVAVKMVEVIRIVDGYSVGLLSAEDFNNRHSGIKLRNGAFLHADIPPQPVDKIAHPLFGPTPGIVRGPADDYALKLL